MLLAMIAATADAMARGYAVYEAAATQYQQCLQTEVKAKPFLSDGEALFRRTEARCSTVERRLDLAEARLWQHGIPEFTGAGAYKGWLVRKAYQLVACQQKGRSSC